MAGDANYPKAVLQLHFDGTNGSTVITDSSVLANVMTAQSGATIITSDSVFGTGCLNTIGSGSCADCPGTINFAWGTGDFTVEGRLKTTDSTGGGVIDFWTSAQQGWQIYLTTAGKLQWYNMTTALVTSTTSVNTGTWFPFAVTRVGTSLRLFVNGTQEGGTITDSTNYSYVSSKLSVGRQLSGSPATATDIIAHIDEVRLLKGVGIYTANYSPAGSAFLDYAGQISGIVHDSSSAPAARTVNAHRRDTGALVGSTVSDAGTGAYTINLPTLDEVTAICLDDVAGTVENDLVIRVIPA
jgi:hypothetical protein